MSEHMGWGGRGQRERESKLAGASKAEGESKSAGFIPQGLKQTPPSLESPLGDWDSRPA